MPSGKTHAVASTINLAAMMMCSGGMVLATASLDTEQAGVLVSTGVGLMAGGIAGIIVTPDIDHQWVTYEEQRIKRWFGKTFLRLWQLFWLPFLLPGHRSKLTHSWPLGMMLRQLWAGGWLAAGACVIVILSGGDPLELVREWLREWPLQTFAFFLFLFVGWSAQDLTHLWLDRKRSTYPWARAYRWFLMRFEPRKEA